MFDQIALLYTSMCSRHLHLVIQRQQEDRLIYEPLPLYRAHWLDGKPISQSEAGLDPFPRQDAANVHVDESELLIDGSH
jgi:hypothetical protein